MAIRIHADAVLTLVDGFTGLALESAGAVITLDGMPFAPVRKPGGVLVFINTSPGEHVITLHQPHFQAEKVIFCADGVGTADLMVALMPDGTYPLPQNAVRIWGRMKLDNAPLANARVLYETTAKAWRMAQDEAAAGEEQVAVYAARDTQHLPMDFMFTGGEKERVRLLTTDGALEGPLKHGHKRGEALVPVRELKTDMDGSFYLCLPQPKRIAFYYERQGKWMSCQAEFCAGDNKEKEIIFEG